MKHFIPKSPLFFLLSSFWFLLPGQSHAWMTVQSQQKMPEYVEGEVVVRFKKGVSLEKQEMILSRLAAKKKLYGKDRRGIRGLKTKNGKKQRRLKLLDHLAKVKLKKEKKVKEAIREYEQDPNVLYAEPNYIYRAQQAFPNDPEFDSLWGLHNTGQDEGQDDADIDAPEAWATTTGSHDVVVAVIDTGVDYTHPDLTDNMWVNEGEIPGNNIDDDGNGYVDDVYGYDFPYADSDPMDVYGHGTHVAGTIGAVANNGEGIAGVAWTVRIMAVKFLNDNGAGSTSAAIDSFKYVFTNGADIINASWGSSFPGRAIEDMINEAQREGIVVVAAAGNSFSGRPHYPASFDNVISVAAIDRFNRATSFTNYGPTVDVAAPGEEILSCIPGARYVEARGTSMAAPHVAGVAALVKAARPDFSNEDIQKILKMAVDPVDSAEYIGTGRINAHKALQFMEPPPPARLRVENNFLPDGKPLYFTVTALGEDFLDYSIEYGTGYPYPVQWIELLRSTQPVEDHRFAVETEQIDATASTFRLIVRTERGNNVWDVVSPILTADFSYINSSSYFMRGSAAGKLFKDYSIETRPVSSQGEWYEHHRSETPVFNGNLCGDFNPFEIEDGYYDFRLVVRDKHGRQVEDVYPNMKIETNGDSEAMIYEGNFYIWILENQPFDIYGTARARGFHHYVMEYAPPGEDFVEIFLSTTQVGKGCLMSNFGPIGQDPGRLKLTIFADQNGEINPVDSHELDLSGLRLRQRHRFRVYRLGDVLSLEGWLPYDYNEYFLEYGVGRDPQTWHATGLTPSRTGPGKAFSGVLGTWDTSHLPADVGSAVPLYQVRLNGRSDGWDWTYAVDYDIHFEQRLKPGWPALVRKMGGRTVNFPIPPRVADLDKDGKKEIITAKMFRDLSYQLGIKLSVFREDGTVWWERDFTSRDYISGCIPVIGDLDGDGWDEIIVADPGSEGTEVMVRVFNHDGSENHDGWPRRIHGGFIGMVLGDMNADGQLELIVNRYWQKNPYSSYWSVVTMFNQKGIILNEFDCPARIRSDPVIGNFDEDPELEVVYGFAGGQVAVYNMDGSFVPGWPQLVHPWIYRFQFAVGDVDEDGTEDLVVASRRYQNEVNAWDASFDSDTGQTSFDDSISSLRVYNRHGELLEGWPVTNFPGEDHVQTGWYEPTLSDFDGDGKLDIAVGSFYSEDDEGWSVSVLNCKGEFFPGWPRKFPGEEPDLPYEGYRPPFMVGVGDINGDRSLDLVVSGPAFRHREISSVGDVVYGGGIYAWNSDGSVIDLNISPLYEDLFLGYTTDGFVTMSDLEGDNKLELIAQSEKSVDGYYHSIHVWSLETDYDPDLVPWPTYKGNNRNTGRYPLHQPPLMAEIVIEDPLYEATDLQYKVDATDPDGNPLTYAVYLAGDLNHDGKVTGSDYTLWKESMHARKGDPAYDVEADLNSDGVVDQVDYALLTEALYTVMPYGVNIDETSGLFTWTLKLGSAGNYRLMFVVTDSENLKAARGIPFTILKSPWHAPELGEITIDGPLYEFEEFQMVIPATDDDNEPLSYAVYLAGDLNHNGNVTGSDYTEWKVSMHAKKGEPAYNPEADLNSDGIVDQSDYTLLTEALYMIIPSGINIDEPGGIFTWTPAFGSAGNYRLMFVVTDPHGFTDARAVSFPVERGPNKAPVFEDIMIEEPLYAGEAFQLYLKATDGNGDPLTFEVYLGGDLNHNGIASSDYEDDGRAFWESYYQTVDHADYNPEADLDNNDVVDYEDYWLFWEQAGNRMSMPGGITLEASTGEFRWTPDVSVSGNVRFMFVVKDPDGAKDTQAVLFEVLERRLHWSKQPSDLSLQSSAGGLQSGYKNVFNPARGETVRIEYQLADAGDVTIHIFDRSGSEVMTILGPSRSMGTHFAEWNGRSFQGHLLPSGVYHYQVRNGSPVHSGKVLLIK